MEVARAEAEKIKLIGAADASAIECVGKAEAEMMRLKAAAYKQYGKAATLSLVLDCLPKVCILVALIVKPWGKTLLSFYPLVIIFPIKILNGLFIPLLPFFRCRPSYRATLTAGCLRVSDVICIVTHTSPLKTNALDSRLQLSSYYRTCVYFYVYEVGMQKMHGPWLP